MNLIPSYAQHGKLNPDTVKCYGFTELQHIAATLVEARACDTLLANANAKLLNRDSLISEKDFVINKMNSQLLLKDKIIDLKEKQLKKATEDLVKERRRHKLTKFGWGSTTVLFGSMLLYFAFN